MKTARGSWAALFLVLIALAALAGCKARRGYSFSGPLQHCSYDDVLKVAGAAIRFGSPHVLNDHEARGIRDKLSAECQKALSGDVLPLTISFDALKDKTADRQVKAFLRFVSGPALRQAQRTFPIKHLDDLADPKTVGVPALGAPPGVPLESLISARIVTDPRLKTLMTGGATVGGKQGVSYVTVGGDGEETKVRLISIPSAEEEGGVRRVRLNAGETANFLIYLPEPYLVATSSSLHRELYPHDSSYIIEAMLTKPTREGLSTVRGMLDDFLYEIQNFGFVLNGNRGYYLTRSQNNTLSTNVLQYVDAAQATSPVETRAWVESKGMPLALGAYAYWASPRGTVDFGGMQGSRWFAYGAGPCQEVWESHGAHKAYYFRVLDELVRLKNTPDAQRKIYEQGFDYGRVVEELDPSKAAHLEQPGPMGGSQGMIGRMYILPGQYSASGASEPVIMAADGKRYTFTPLYYENDRASRVSGYDSNFLYGPYNAFTGDFVPAALNALLYRQERDIATLRERAGDDVGAASWRAKAAARKRMLLATMWDEELGMLFDYDAVTKRRRTVYPFAGSAYALWAGLFDVHDAKERTMVARLVSYVARHLEGPDGLYASGVVTGLHWDKPFCWPIQQGMIVRGLRDYAAALAEVDPALSRRLVAMADRVALKYLGANYRNWLRSKGKKILEKVGPDKGVFTGYENGENYTWNLAAVWDLYDGLSMEARNSLYAYVALLDYNLD